MIERVIGGKTCRIVSDRDDLEGKLIRKVSIGYYDDQCTLALSDGYATFGAGLDHECMPFIYIEIYRSPTVDDLHYFGDITDEELATIEKTNREMQEQEQEAADRILYEKLKARFGA